MNRDLVAKLLFPAPKPTYGLDTFPVGELLWMPRRPGPVGSMSSGDPGPGERVPCLLLPYASARFIIYYIHSNAEDLGRCRGFCVNMRAQFQAHVFAVEYPGYGLCPGGPCDERGATECALAGLRFLREGLRWPLDSIIVLGRSIGCGPAVALAANYEVAGLILVSPMLSFKELLRDIFGLLEPLLRERFPNNELVKRVSSPLLIVHGQKDDVIPTRHGLELFRAAGRCRKLLVSPPDLGHNADLFSNVNYMVLPMLQFFALPDYCFEEMEIPAWAHSHDGSAPASPDVPRPPAVLSREGDERPVGEEHGPKDGELAWEAATSCFHPTLGRPLLCGPRTSQRAGAALGLRGDGPGTPCGRPVAVPLAASAGIFVRAPPVPEAVVSLGEDSEVEGRHGVPRPICATPGAKARSSGRVVIRLPRFEETTASRNRLREVRGAPCGSEQQDQSDDNPLWAGL